MTHHTLLLIAPFVFGAAVAHAQPAAPRWRLVEDLRLDAAREAFTELTAVRVGPRGQLVVPMYEDYRVRIYDSSASRFTAVGGVGSGPGEFTELSSFGWVADTLWIADGVLARISFFSPNGRLLRVRSLPALPISVTTGRGAGFIRTLAPAAVYADGSVLSRATMSRASTLAVGEVTQSAVVHLSTAGRARVVMTIPGETVSLVRVSVGRGQFGTAVPFEVRPRTAVSPDGGRLALLTTDFTSAAAGVFTLRVIGPDGAPTLERAYPFVGTPIPEGVIDSVVGRARAAIGARGGSSVAAAEMEALLRQRMPPAYAPVVLMFLGVDGTTWLGLRPSSAGNVVLVLDERGDPIGSVRVPARSQIVQGSRTHVWVTERTTGQPISVVRYRVESA